MDHASLDRRDDDTGRRLSVATWVASALLAFALPGGLARADQTSVVDLAAAVERGIVTAVQEGLVSWYGAAFHDRPTASGERFDSNGFTMAHPTLPFGTEVKVTNLRNGRSVVVRVNDRGPHVGQRIADLSRAAASQIGMLKRGVVRARIEVLDADPSPGTDMSGDGALAAPRLERREPWPERIVAAVLRKTLQTTLLPTFRAERPIDDQRRRLRRVTRLTLRPRGVRFEPGLCGGVGGEFVRPRGATGPARAGILYLHGGAYCVGSPVTHRAITGTLARLTGATVFVADYRLAPEHPCPAAIDDAVAAYLGLVASGHAPRHVAIAGDSAGGGLALAAALRLRELGHALPAALVAFSPWVDLDDPDRGLSPPEKS